MILKLIVEKLKNHISQFTLIIVIDQLLVEIYFIFDTNECIEKSTDFVKNTYTSYRNIYTNIFINKCRIIFFILQ